MRFLAVFALFVALAVVAMAVPVENSEETQQQSLYDVDVQGHENTGEREARQFGYGGFGGYRGGYGGFGGYRGGYGGYRGGYGGYGGYGGFRGGYGGFGGYRGGFYG
ncbi:uncharacterized protein LOC101887397 [Musca domestica]|uniref:H/ACA ribonucleoprotein complex subunit 1 n=1 Tax=Musca domestica TaxID=7370 RepID=A0A1I8N428_MUSDO|nr:uncharacterized protein LOC101887397 [Musca domestica]